MLMVRNLAGFAVKADASQLSEEAAEQIRIRLLDSVACAYGALPSGLPLRIRSYVDELGGTPSCALIGGGRAAPDRAAFYNGVLVRYLDFNDSYLASGETCHPSDNIPALMAATEYAGGSGTDLMTAIALSYQVQCRLSDQAPVRDRGFDHTVQGVYAAAAGVSRALGLDENETAHAIAIAGTANNALRVTRTGSLSNWKGMAAPAAAEAATRAAFLARHGVTGPSEVFEGEKGFMHSIAGYFELDWQQEDLERVTRTILKKYNSEIHSQTAVEAALALREEHRIDPREIDHILVETFDVAYDIIGGGAEGEKVSIRTKEEADHSLPYIVAVALLDGDVLPAQYRSARIHADDVQDLLRRVEVNPIREFSARFPEEMTCRVTVFPKSGRSLLAERSTYEGFHDDPMTWDSAREKFERLAGEVLVPAQVQDIASAIRNIDGLRLQELAEILPVAP